jgi:alpha-L-rhamnosidase
MNNQNKKKLQHMSVATTDFKHVSYLWNDEEAAKDLIVNYWGDMVKKGADTFWEVYDPKDDFSSPYKFSPVNSYCHAWSCTPVYFIRKHPQIFQQ